MGEPVRRTTVGKAPDPGSLRRRDKNDIASWIRLPGRGLAEVPEWPVEAIDRESPVTMAEQAYWNRIWAEYPQAHIWKRSRMEMQVATYVRLALFCASGYPKPAFLAALARLDMELLISVHAMRAARVIIDEKIDDVVEEQTHRLGVAPVIQIGGGSVRSRMGAAPPAAPEDDDEPDEDDEDDEDEDVIDDDDK
jgi:hypothetical protein